MEYKAIIYSWDGWIYTSYFHEDSLEAAMARAVLMLKTESRREPCRDWSQVVSGDPSMWTNVSKNDFHVDLWQSTEVFPEMPESGYHTV